MLQVNHLNIPLENLYYEQMKEHICIFKVQVKIPGLEIHSLFCANALGQCEEFNEMA